MPVRRLRRPEVSIGCLLLMAHAVPLMAQRDLRLDRGGRRVALIIGNNGYSRAPLVNAANDARAMDATLRESGFEAEVLLDANARKMHAAIDHLASRLSAGDVALFYFAGHGVQIDGENYLVPVDFDGRDETDLKYESISASWVQEKLDRTGAQLKILILDACRNNPFRATRGGPAGLAQMQGGRGTFVAFATAAGKVANDNAGANNGLFTQYLVKALQQPGLSLDEVFNRVREDVDKASNGLQLPYIYSGVIGQFHFRTEAPNPEAKQPIRITRAVLVREPTPSGIDPRLGEPENEFLTTDPHVVVMFTYTGGYKGDKIRGEWRNPFGSVSGHFDIEQRGDGGGYVYFWYLPIAPGEPARMPGNWELRILWNGQGVAILPFHVSVPPASPVRFISRTVLPRGTVTIPYRYELRADGGSPPYRWSVLSNPPPGLSLSPSGVLEGLPQRRGSYRVGVRVEDSGGNVITRMLGLGIGIVPESVHVARYVIARQTAASDVCATRAEDTRFSTRVPSASLVFSMEGDKQDDWATVEWMAPSGDVLWSTQLKREADRRPCYAVSMPIAGRRAASSPGTWHVRLLWRDGEILNVPVEISGADVPAMVR